MTNLTEQWKKGELSTGYFYMQMNNGDIRIITNNLVAKIAGYSILAPVPSYEEYQKLLSDQLAKIESEEINAELEAENAKLKTEYEKECHRADELEDSYWKSEKENTKLKKQVAIAVEALDSLRGICYPQRAEKALEQIKELDK